MRRLRHGFEPLETRTPPASLLGALADFFGQEEDGSLADLQRSNSAGDPERESPTEEHARAPAVSKVEVEPIGGSNDDPSVVSSHVSKEPGLSAKIAIDRTDLFPIGPATPDVEGVARVVKTSHSAIVVIAARNLVPGPYTAQAVFFNAPENCSGTCGGDDLGLGAAGGVFIASVDAKEVGNHGRANFVNHFRESPDGPLTDAEAAEIHVLISLDGDLVAAGVTHRIVV